MPGMSANDIQIQSPALQIFCKPACPGGVLSLPSAPVTAVGVGTSKYGGLCVIRGMPAVGEECLKQTNGMGSSGGMTGCSMDVPSMAVLGAIIAAP